MSAAKHTPPVLNDELSLALLASLEEILYYDGEAASPLHDDSVMDRAALAYAKATGEAV